MLVRSSRWEGRSTCSPTLAGGCGDSCSRRPSRTRKKRKNFAWDSPSTCTERGSVLQRKRGTRRFNVGNREAAISETAIERSTETARATATRREASKRVIVFCAAGVFPLPSRFRRPFIPVSSGWRDSGTQAQRCQRRSGPRPRFAKRRSFDRTMRQQQVTELSRRRRSAREWPSFLWTLSLAKNR